jgi:hypothetical protein
VRATLQLRISMFVSRMSRPATTPPDTEVVGMGAVFSLLFEKKKRTIVQMPPATTTKPPPNQPKVARLCSSCKNVHMSCMVEYTV